MAEREASGEFDYLIGDLAEAPSETEVSDGDDAPPEPVPPDEFNYPPGDEDPAQDSWDEPAEGFWTDAEPVPAAEPVPEGAFDAFDSDTWYFEPAPAPWYRGKQVLIALIAAATAAAALVVAAVLLVFSPGGVEDATTSVTETAPTTAPTTPVSTELATSSRPPAPPPPPPPPPATPAPPVDPAPAETYRPRSPAPRSANKPEIGVTRTPVTRPPISVAPQRPGSAR